MSLTPQQLAERKNYIGASESAAVLGLSPFQSAADLYFEKVGDVEPRPATEAMESGTRLEPVIIDWCAARLGVAETRVGRWGVRGLLDPHTVRDLFPDREEVEAFEEVLADAVTESLVRHGDRKTVARLRDQYGLTAEECAGLVSQVDERASRQQERTTEQWRTRILSYLDVIRTQATAALDVRTARWAVRDMATVSGVLRADVDDMHREMEGAVDLLDAEDRAKKQAQADESESLDEGGLEGVG